MKKWIIGFAAIPILGWIASLLHNWSLGGKLFFYSDIAYAPLFIITFPCEPIMRWLSNVFSEHTHRLIFLYAIICAIIYGLLGSAVGYVIRFYNSPKPQSSA
jgi:hypothetical protein